MTKQITKKRTIWLGVFSLGLVLGVLGVQHMQAEAEEPRGPEEARHGEHHFQGPPPIFDDADFPMLMTFLLQGQEDFAFKGEGAGPGPEGRPERGRREGRGARGNRGPREKGPEAVCGPECKGCEKCQGKKGPRGEKGHHGFGRRDHHGGLFGMMGPGGHGGPFGMMRHGHHDKHGGPDKEMRKMMMGNMGRLMALRADLDVSKEQREQLHGVMKSHKSSLHEKFGGVMKARKDLQSQIILGEATEESIKTSAAQIAEAVTAAALEAKTARDAAMAVFSEDQQSMIQEVLTKNIATRKAMHEKMKAKKEEHKAKWEAKKKERKEKKETENKSEK